MYITNHAIYDTKDGKRYYKRGVTYPAQGVEVSAERLAELVKNGHISRDLKSHTVAELKEIAKREGLEGYEGLKKQELIKLLEG